MGRKDKVAIRAATGRLDHADGVVTAAETALAGHAKELAAERAATRGREVAVPASAPDRV